MVPGMLAREAELPSKAPNLKKQGIDAQFASVDPEGLEAALARGGEDPRGADIAILPLPEFVASLERLKALDPVVFLVVGWSEGRDVVLAKQAEFNPPASGAIKLGARPGSAAAYMALFGLETLAVGGERVSVVSPVASSGDWDLLATSKREAKESSATLLFGTADASRLIPVVAVAQSGFVVKQEPTVMAFARAWFDGQRALAEDASGAARRVASEHGAIEPLQILEGLGELSPASLGENTALMALSGRGAATLERRFDRTWTAWRSVKLLGAPPERTPLDSRIVAGLVLAGGDLKPPPSKSQRATPGRTGKPLLVYRAPRGALAEDKVSETAAFLADVFPRSPITVTVHRGGEVDSKLTAGLVTRCTDRFGLVKGRVVEGKARARDGAAATIEVMPIP
jgi:hypothetical protein